MKLIQESLFVEPWPICPLCELGIPPSEQLPPNSPAQPTWDHIIPRTVGGTDEPTNLQLVHRLCNVVKSTWPTGRRSFVELCDMFLGDMPLPNLVKLPWVTTPWKVEQVTAALGSNCFACGAPKTEPTDACQDMTCPLNDVTGWNDF